MGLWRVLSDLEEDGYRTEWGLFSAEETGAPHQRIRCFILAYRGGLRSTPGISGQIAGQEGQSEEFNHDSGGQLVNPASEGLEGCARESVQGRSEGSARTDGAELGDTKHDGLHGDSFSGGRGEDRERSEEGKKASEQSEGASGQEDLRHLQPTELAHTASREPRQSQARNGGQDTSGGSEEELGNSGIERCEQDSALRDKQQARGIEQIGGNRGSEEELADPNRDEQTEERGDDGEVLKIPQIEGQKYSPTLLGGGDTDTGSEDTRWPARPGEEQYEWEEPRVVADSKHKRSVQSEHSARCGEELSKDGESARRSTETQSNDEAQSELGGAVDGLTHRVDRLRLLGNGVVPQTAEIAWKTLWQRI